MLFRELSDAGSADGPRNNGELTAALSCRYPLKRQPVAPASPNSVGVGGGGLRGCRRREIQNTERRSQTRDHDRREPKLFFSPREGDWRALSFFLASANWNMHSMLNRSRKNRVSDRVHSPKRHN